MSIDYRAAADAAAQSAGIPAPIFQSLITQESAWNPVAYSSKGAIGLTQLMPNTASALNVNPWDTTQNLQGGASYLSQLFAKFGNWRDALAAYNAGPNNLSAGFGYADKVLNAAGLNSTAQPTTSAATEIPSFWSDPIGNLKGYAVAGLSNFVLIGAAGLLIAFGVWKMTMGDVSPIQAAKVAGKALVE